MDDTYVENGEGGVGRPRADKNAVRRVADGERQRQRGRRGVSCVVRTPTSTDDVGGGVELHLTTKRLLLTVDDD